MNGIMHDVFGIHGLFEVVGYALHCDYSSRTAAAGATVRTTARQIQIDGVRECEAKSDRSKEHLDTYEKVLPTGSYGTGTETGRTLICFYYADFLEQSQEYT